MRVRTAALAPLLAACGDPLCPPEMAAVGAPGSPAFCIDRWENAVVLPDGADPAQAPHERVVAEGRLRSEAGRLPSIGLSYDEAVLLCAREPVLFGGVERGRKRLPTLAEWLDAADGQLGEGGSAFPYGDREIPGRCNIGDPEHGALAPAGSFPGCESAFGVFDQMGNAFEWADSGMTLDVARSLAQLAERGIALEARTDGRLAAPPGLERGALITGATAIRSGSVRPGPGGLLVADWEGTRPFPKGYLALRDHPISPENALPVRFLTTTAEEPAAVLLDAAEDGLPIPAKVGGSFYTVSTWPGQAFDHTHDFNGTISFRCAADPAR